MAEEMPRPEMDIPRHIVPNPSGDAQQTDDLDLRNLENDFVVPEAFELSPDVWRGALRIHRTAPASLTFYAHCEQHRSSLGEAMQDAYDLAHLMLNKRGHSEKK